MTDFKIPLREVEGCPGVFTLGRSLLTINGAPGKQVYGEPLIIIDEKQYRVWDPMRSKLAGMILEGARDFGLRKDSKVLYLGAASGTTASHVADIAADGFVYCVEVSQRSFRDLVKVCEDRRNMIPIMADASQLEEYAHMIEGVELVYQDVAQRNQVDIFVRNMASFDAESGILMLKARSIDVSRDPREVFSQVKDELTRKTLKVRQVVDLEKYARDHAAFIVEA